MAHLRTRAVHAGQQPDPGTGATATPITQTTAFGYGTLEHGAAIFAGEAPGYRYSRFANPTVAALGANMADLEGAQAAVAFASGTAATSSVLLGLLNPGDEIAFLGPLYGGTEGLFRQLGERFGIRVVDATQQGLAASLTPATRMVWVETLTNPSLHLHDLAEVAAIAKARGVLTVADNTFCTPYLARPLEYGIDLAMHSMTKYLGGHGDATGGIVAGPAALIALVRKTGLGHVGGNLSPQEAFLFLRGIKTLPLRMAAHCEGAAAVVCVAPAQPVCHMSTYSILLVCTDNLCRSPTAEEVLRQKATQRGLADRLNVASASTHDLNTGEAIDFHAQKHAMRRGYDLSRLRARLIQAADFERFDLILAMEESNLLMLRLSCPQRYQDKLHYFTQYCSDQACQDVPDPFYGQPQDFERVLDMIEDGCEGILLAVAAEIN